MIEFKGFLQQYACSISKLKNLEFIKKKREQISKKIKDISNNKLRDLHLQMPSIDNYFGQTRDSEVAMIEKISQTSSIFKAKKVLIETIKGLILKEVDILVIGQSVDSVCSSLSTNHNGAILCERSIITIDFQDAISLTHKNTLFSNLKELMICDIRVAINEEVLLEELLNSDTKLLLSKLKIRKFEF